MDVVFVVMPFADTDFPTIGVSLLKSHTIRHGFSATVCYLNIDFAEWIGSWLYRLVSVGAGSRSHEVYYHFPPNPLAGEWLFSRFLFSDQLPPGDDYIERFLAADLHIALIFLACCQRHCHPLPIRDILLDL